MAEHLAKLVGQISPKITAQDVSELPLLTRGAQWYGSNNNATGKGTLDVFVWVADIVKDFIVNQDAKKIIILNASKRKVILALSTDPDIRIQEERGNFETRWLLKSKVERMSVTPTIAPVKRRSPIKR